MKDRRLCCAYVVPLKCVISIATHRNLKADHASDDKLDTDVDSDSEEDDAEAPQGSASIVQPTNTHV